MRLDHPIFHQPLEAQIVLEDIPTPGNYRAHDGGSALADALPAWRVLNAGPDERDLRRVGLVSDPHGFEDSPDTEWISSGVNSKGPRSLAIGRQANLFLWGFAGDPSQMTESARRVFVNAIVYVRRFDGTQPLVRNAARSRAWIPDLLAFASGLKDAQDQAGMLERWFGADVWKACGGTVEGLRAWTAANLEQLHEVRAGEWESHFAVDEDLRALGISNRTPEFLTSLIARWRADPKDEVAPRLLARYVDGQTIANADELERWHKANADRLFFSDMGGYRWFVAPRASAPVPAGGR
jgi:hypothetical protein